MVSNNPFEKKLIKFLLILIKFRLNVLILLIHHLLFNIDFLMSHYNMIEKNHIISKFLGSD